MLGGEPGLKRWILLLERGKSWGSATESAEERAGRRGLRVAERTLLEWRSKQGWMAADKWVMLKQKREQSERKELGDGGIREGAVYVVHVVTASGSDFLKCRPRPAPTDFIWSCICSAIWKTRPCVYLSRSCGWST